MADAATVKQMPLVLPLPFMVEANVLDYGHDRATNELHVRFRNGGHYVYKDVPETKYHEMLAAESAGGFVGAHLRNKFEFRKL